MTTAPELLAKELADLRRRLAAMERRGQLSRSTIVVDGEDVPLTDAVAVGLTAGAALPGLQEEVAANSADLGTHAETIDTLDTDLATARVDIGIAQEDTVRALDDAASAIIAADLARQNADAVGSRINDEIVPAINDAAASPITDARLTAGSLTVWPFQADAIPAGALAPGAVASGDIADFAITVKKLKSDRHHLY